MTLKEQGLTTQAKDLLVPYTDSNRTPVGMNYLGIIAFPSSSFFCTKLRWGEEEESVYLMILSRSTCCQPETLFTCCIICSLLNQSHYPNLKHAEPSSAFEKPVQLLLLQLEFW
jgi:hypothetical protein